MKIYIGIGRFFGSGVSRSPADLELFIFFINSETFGMQILRKKPVNYDKFEIATKQRKSNIYTECIISLPFDRCYKILPYYLLVFTDFA